MQDCQVDSLMLIEFITYLPYELNQIVENYKTSTNQHLSNCSLHYNNSSNK
jgi:hypothetical protein